MKIFILLIIFSARAFANSGEESKFCADPTKLQLTDCQFNSRLSQAAVDCWKKFQPKLSHAKARMEQLKIKAGDAQSLRLDEAETRYKAAALELTSLQLLATKAADEIDHYFDAMALPEDFENDEIVKNLGGPDAFLDSSKCFFEPEDIVEQVLDRFEKAEKDLASANLTSAFLKKSSGTREIGLEGPGAPSPGRAQPAPVPASAGGAQGRKIRNSDVSGTQEIKKK